MFRQWSENIQLPARNDPITAGEMPGVSGEDKILRSIGADAASLRMVSIFDRVDIDKASLRMAPGVLGNQGDEVDHQSLATVYDRKGWLEERIR